MTIQEALEVVKRDRQILERANSDLQTVESLYAVGEYEKALDLYGQIDSRLRMGFNCFPLRPRTL